MLHFNENRLRQICRQLRFNIMIEGSPISAICTGCNKRFSGIPGQSHEDDVLLIRAEFADHACKAPSLPDEVPEWVN